jgi:hypothetical protein
MFPAGSLTISIPLPQIVRQYTQRQCNNYINLFCGFHSCRVEVVEIENLLPLIQHDRGKTE